MSISIKLTKDDLSPSLRRQLALAQNPTRVMLAAGTQLVSITQRSFTIEALRQTAWPAKADGSPSNLILKGMLRSSIRITEVGPTSVSVGSDRQYAAIHQFGGIIRPIRAKMLAFTIGGKKVFARQVTIPARPFFPFTKDGHLASFAVEKVGKIMQQALATEAGAHG